VLHEFGCPLSSASSALPQDVPDVVRPLRKLASAFPRFGEVGIHQGKQLLFCVSVSITAGQIRGAHARDRCVVTEKADQGKNVAGIRILGLLQRRRVGHDAHDFLLELLALVEDADRIAVAL